MAQQRKISQQLYQLDPQTLTEEQQALDEFHTSYIYT